MDQNRELRKKRKMQNVDFRTVDEFLDYLPDDERKMTESLRAIILDTIPDAIEKLAYNVPFYKRHANICFIWPSSIPWGKVTQKGVRLGFSNGYLMQDDIGFLDRGHRKQVYWHDFLSLKDMDASLVRAYVSDAVVIDDAKKKKK